MERLINLVFNSYEDLATLLYFFALVTSRAVFRVDLARFIVTAPISVSNETDCLYVPVVHFTGSFLKFFLSETRTEIFFV